MKFRNFSNLVILSGLAACSTLPGMESTSVPNDKTRITSQDYGQAEKLLGQRADAWGGVVNHHWIGTSNRFWYEQRGDSGTEYLVVDAQSRLRTEVLKLTDVRKWLEEASNERIETDGLKVLSIADVEGKLTASVMLKGRTWRCEFQARLCISERENPNQIPGELMSPDGKWGAFTRDYNIWLRSVVTGTEFALTKNGEENNAYGAMAGSSGTVMARKSGLLSPPPVAIWSPDSKRIITHSLDERNVSEAHLLQSVPDLERGSKPVLHSYKFASPEEKEFPIATLHILSLDGKRVEVEMGNLEVGLFSPIMDERVWWSEDSKEIYVLPRELYQKRLELLRVNPLNGVADPLIVERSATYVDSSPSGVGSPVTKVLRSGNIVWYSERSGWGHLYNYDSSGNLINQITRGDWQVRKIVYIDDDGEEIFFVAGGREKGRNPYYNHLYSIRMDGSGLRLLTPENADHDIEVATNNFISKFIPGFPTAAEAGFSSSGEYFIDQYSRPNLPTKTVLRHQSGELVLNLGREVDVSSTTNTGLYPEPFEVDAADGKTKIYGTLFRPRNFDPKKDYPIVDFLHPGPYSIRTRNSFQGALSDEARSMADLGFVTVTIDGRGTPYRSKEFHDHSYGIIGPTGTLDDHVAAIRQLAARYEYIDLERVGAYGHSGGGAAAARAILEFPDFFKVSVSASGSHNPRNSTLLVGTTYLGEYSEKLYWNASNAKYASNLEGKLFLIHGDLDETVNPSQTMHLVNALVRSNKTFDMLIIPNGTHSFGESRSYVRRRQWDYFVKNLLNVDPPSLGPH